MIERMGVPRIYDTDSSKRIMRVMKMDPMRIYTSNSTSSVDGSKLEIDPEILELAMEIDEYREVE